MTQRSPLRLALPVLAILSGANALDADAAAHVGGTGTPRRRALSRGAGGRAAGLKASPRRLAKRGEWESVVLRYRSSSPATPAAATATTPSWRSATSTGRWQTASTPRAIARMPSPPTAASSPSTPRAASEKRLYSALEITREAGDRRKLADAARAYLATYPEGRRAKQVKRLLQQREPSVPLPSRRPPGLASVFDLRGLERPTPRRASSSTSSARSRSNPTA